MKFETSKQANESGFLFPSEVKAKVSKSIDSRHIKYFGSVLKGAVFSVQTGSSTDGIKRLKISIVDKSKDSFTTHKPLVSVDSVLCYVGDVKNNGGNIGAFCRLFDAEEVSAAIELANEAAKKIME